jgi:hypothetical protein
MLHFGAGCHQIVTKTYELCHRVAFGIEICVRVAHGRNDSRMSEQLLDCHYIPSAIHQPGSERMPQLVPRHALDSGLSARESKTRVEINKGFSGFMVIENELVLSPHRPNFQDWTGVRVHRDTRVLRVLCAKIERRPFSRSTLFQRSERISPIAASFAAHGDGRALSADSAFRNFFSLPHFCTARDTVLMK